MCWYMDFVSIKRDRWGLISYALRACVHTC